MHAAFIPARIDKPKHRDVAPDTSVHPSALRAIAAAPDVLARRVRSGTLVR